MGRIVFVLGGARSGKSRHAQQLAREAGERRGGRIVYLATAEAGDGEMRERIRRHRLERPASWRTVEAPRQAARALAAAAAEADAVLVDCLTLLISNLLADGEEGAEARVSEEVEALIAAARAGQAEVVIVSNEVGLGVVPASPLGRLFRDLAGLAHQRLAREADEVYWMVAGLPQRIK